MTIKDLKSFEGSKNVEDLLSAGANYLTAQNIETAQLDARVLLDQAQRVARMQAAGEGFENVRDKFMAYAERRIQGESVARIVGQREFWSLAFIIGADVFDPRPESETLVEAAMRHKPRDEARVLDLGTGSGCLLLSLLSACREMRGLGIDILPEAVRMARYNARRLALSPRAHFFVGDWMLDYQGAFDLLLSNPPYIPSGDLAGLAAEVRHDPRSALDGGADGLLAYRRLAALAPSLLAPGGRIIVEIGAEQADRVSEIFTLAGLTINDIIKDLSGHQRVVVAS